MSPRATGFRVERICDHPGQTPDREPPIDIRQYTFRFDDGHTAIYSAFSSDYSMGFRYFTLYLKNDMRALYVGRTSSIKSSALLHELRYLHDVGEVVYTPSMVASYWRASLDYVTHEHPRGHSRVEMADCRKLLEVERGHMARLLRTGSAATRRSIS